MLRTAFWDGDWWEVVVVWFTEENIKRVVLHNETRGTICVAATECK
jgi:hypothetical protein